MPLYEYSCRACGREFEVLVRAGSVPSCPACHGEDLERLLSIPGSLTTPERNLALAKAERKRWQPVHKGREYEEFQSALKEHEEHRMDFAETKKHHDS
jgi:putative FmdB family regulatory protein